MNIVLDNYTPLISYLSPASIPQIVAHIQDYLLKHPILSVETVAEIIVQSLQEHPEFLNGEAIPISADSEQSIKAYIDALPFLDTYTKAEINQLLLGKQDTLTFDQAPTPGSSNPVTSSGIIAALSALQTALETQIGLKADSASTYTKTQVDTLLEDKADTDNVYSKNTIDAKFLEVNTEIDNVNDALDDQSQQIANLQAAAAYVEDGDTASREYTEGQFILWRGLLYTVKTGGMPQGETISTTYLESVTGGGFNDIVSAINSLIPVSVPLTHVVPSYPEGMSDHDGGCFYAVYGNIVYLRVSIKMTGERTIGDSIIFNHNIPNAYRPNRKTSIVISDGTVSGTVTINVGESIFQIFPKKSSGTEYFIGTYTYVI